MAYVVAIICAVAFGLFIRNQVKKSRKIGDYGDPGPVPPPKFPPDSDV